ncbi:MAG TPA: hypothetical protein VNO70_05930 [Blastocatellia bacterium]|nr:hypothetical protein [Blastocatellia bacterium]
MYRLGEKVRPHLQQLWNDLTTHGLKPEIVANRLRQTQLIPDRMVRDVLGGRPEYLDHIVDFLQQQRQKVVTGGLTPRDVAKAYFITASSQGSDAIRVNVLQDKLRAAGVHLEIPPEYATPNKRGEAMIRPEEAAGAWLLSPNGQRALNDLERGVFNEALWQEGAKVRAAFGDDRLSTLNVFGPARGKKNMRDIAEITEQMNRVKGNPNRLGMVAAKLNGVAAGKTGFLKHLLGFGDAPTLDAVELNFWLTGKGDISRLQTRQAELARATKDFWNYAGVSSTVNPRIQRRIKQLQEILPDGSTIPPDVAGHVLHQWIWSRAKGVEASHRAMYDAMEKGFLLLGGRKTPIADIIVALRKAGFLTGSKTQARNIGGNTLMQAMEEISRIPASMIDIGISLATGRRTVQGMSPMAVAKASREAATKGLRDAAHILRHGATQQQLAAQTLPQEVVSGVPFLDVFINGSFRLQSAQDAVFKSFAARRSLEEQARLYARDEARRGVIKREDVTARAREIVEGKNIGKTEYNQMLLQATEDAAFATFQNETAFTKWVDETVQKAPKPIQFGIEMIAPFGRTPANVMARVLDYSPVGAAKGSVNLAAAVLKGAFTPAEQRAFAQACGRATTGTAAIILGYKLAEKGLATGFSSEDDFDRRAMDQTRGRLEGAVRVGDTWIEVGRYSPIGNLLALGAGLYERFQEEDSSTAGAVYDKGIQALQQQPLLGAFEDIRDITRKPQKFASDLIGSFVPSLMADIAAAGDVEREAPGLFDKALRRIPGARGTLPPKLDLLGREIPAKAGLNPIAMQQDRGSKALDEMVKHNLPLGPMKRGKESDAEYRQRLAEAGKLREERLNLVVSSPLYDKLPAPAQRAVLAWADRSARRDYKEGKRAPQELTAYDLEVRVAWLGARERLERSAEYKRLGEKQQEAAKEAVNRLFRSAKAKRVEEIPDARLELRDLTRFLDEELKEIILDVKDRGR